MHGGAISLAGQARVLSQERPEAPARADVYLVSDMLDLPVFLALAGGGLAGVPAVLYFHENQLTYVLPPETQRDLGYGMKNVASALAAKRVLFNSAYHREEFLGAVEELLEAMPDQVPRGVPETLRAKSGVLPVGCDLRALDRHHDRARVDTNAGRWGNPAEGPLVLWNHRWEYDKAPEEMFAAMVALKEEGVRFRLAVAGPGQGSVSPAVFAWARERLGDRIVQWGKVPSRGEYASLLWASDVVVSTAIHEFFGVSVVEALYCGCRPVLPARLSYPEIVPREAHDRVLYGEGGLVERLREALAEPVAWSQDWQRTWVVKYDWTSIGPRYDEEMRRCWRMAQEER
jgi:glycosyltransferase involved in cell wall biosynthesis